MDHHTEELTVGIEVGGIKTTVIALHHGEHHLGRDAGLLGLGHIHIHHILWIVGVVRGHGLLHLRALVEFDEEVLGHAEEFVQVAAGLVLHGHRHTVLHREARNHRWSEGKDLSVFDAGRLLIDHSQYGVLLVGIDHEGHWILVLDGSLDAVGDTTGTVFKGLQLDDERGLVGTLAGNEVITKNGVAVQDGWIVGQHLVHLIHNLLGAFLRGSRISRDGHEYRSSILVWHQTGLGGIHQNSQRYDTDNNE